MQDFEFKGIWTSDIATIRVSLPLIAFEQEAISIIYCPALEISGYGNNENEALDSFKIAFGEFFAYTMNRNTLYKELERLGWIIKKQGKPMTPPSMTKLLLENENFSNIFNNYPFRKYNSTLHIPAA